MTPQGTRSSTGTVALTSGRHTPASFYLTGERDVAFTITLSSGPAILTNPSTSKTMIVTNWVSVPVPGTGQSILTGGSQVVNVGASLVVGTIEDNPVGVYSGTYSITFDYN